MNKYQCECCDYFSLDTKNNYEICEVCFWEDDSTSYLNNLDDFGCNNISLREGRKNFLKYGACEKRFIKDVISEKNRSKYKLISRNIELEIVITAQDLLDEYILGNIENSEIPKFAIKLIEKGYESDSLYILAGLEEGNYQEIEKYFKKTIKELDLEKKDYWDIVIDNIIIEIKNGIDKGTKYYDYLDELNPEKLFEIINKILLKDSSDKIISTLAIGPFEDFAIYCNNGNDSKVKKYYDLLLKYGIENKYFLKFLNGILKYTYCSDKDKNIILEIIEDINKVNKKYEK